MKTLNTIEEIREEGRKLCKEINNCHAVIILTQYTAKKSIYGIQYWSNEMISKGTSKNTDNTVSTLIEKL